MLIQLHFLLVHLHYVMLVHHIQCPFVASSLSWNLFPSRGNVFPSRGILVFIWYIREFNFLIWIMLLLAIIRWIRFTVSADPTISFRLKISEILAQTLGKKIYKIFVVPYFCVEKIFRRTLQMILSAKFVVKCFMNIHKCISLHLLLTYIFSIDVFIWYDYFLPACFTTTLKI